MNLDHHAPKALALLRIMTALLFLAHGTQKLLSFPTGERAGSGLALDNPGAFAGLIELVCGLLIAILYCFVFLLLAVAGPGAWSIDNGRKRR
jgi:putative oxidoreductase